MSASVPHHPRLPNVGLRTRQLVFASLLLWLVCAGVWAGLLGLERQAGCPGFQPSDSVFEGTQRWQWVPPGLSCTYRVGGQVHTDSPPTARIAVLGLLVLWPVMTVGFARAATVDLAAITPSGRGRAGL